MTTLPFLLNAAFSTGCGVALLVGGGDLADRLGLPRWLAAGLGLGLLLFGASIVAAVRLRRGRWGVVAADAGWVLAATVVLVAGWTTPDGRSALAWVTVVVAVVAVAQSLALLSEPGAVVRVEHERDVAGDAWSVVADLDGYHRHVPGLVRSDIVSGAGVGAVRECEDTAGGTWRETVTEWVPGRRVRVDVDVATYPSRFRALFHGFTGEWWTDDGRVGIRFTATMRNGMGWMASQVEDHLDRDLPGILESYESAIPV